MTREDRVIQIASLAPESARKALREAFSGSASPRQAIKAMCLACVGFDRSQVEKCSGWSCPLWKYRPFQKVDAQ